jgi:signal transduction histidine kinase
MRQSRLFWEILLSVSVAASAASGMAVWLLERHSEQAATATVEAEARAGLRAYEALWKSQADRLASVATLLAATSEIRGAFSTGDPATIRDTTTEMWSNLSIERAFFLAIDGQGRVITELGGDGTASPLEHLAGIAATVGEARRQMRGFLLGREHLYQVVASPVEVRTGGETLPLHILVAGHRIDDQAALRLKEDTGGNDFLFLANGKVVAASLPAIEAATMAGKLTGFSGENAQRIQVAEVEYLPLRSTLVDLEGKALGVLWISRSLAGAQRQIQELRRYFLVIWLAALGGALGMTFVLVRGVVGPIRELDRAARAIMNQDYDVEARVQKNNELGMLAKSFNAMSASIRQAREDLIHHERISTIARLSSAIVHDLRNPLASIYSAADLLLDDTLDLPQVRRLGRNMQESADELQQLMTDLEEVASGRSASREVRRLSDAVEAACDTVRRQAGAQGVSITVDVPMDIELKLERFRMERAFSNLLINSVESMPGGGSITIKAERHGDLVEIAFEDSGPGIPAAIRDRLFKPFATHGKKHGWGLGLTSSREAVLAHQGEMWLDRGAKGAKFVIRLPLAPKESPKKAVDAGEVVG